jgi:hypothetical protein
MFVGLFVNNILAGMVRIKPTDFSIVDFQFGSSAALQNEMINRLLALRMTRRGSVVDAN